MRFYYKNQLSSNNVRDRQNGSSPLLPTKTVLEVLQPFPPLPKTMDFEGLVYTVELCIVAAIDSPYTIQQLHGPTLSSLIITPLVESLLYPKDKSGEKKNFSDQHNGIVAALMVARQDLAGGEEEDIVTGYIDRGLADSRAATAEIIATQFLYHVRNDSQRISFVLFECGDEHEDEDTNTVLLASDETTPLLNVPQEARQEVERKCCLDQSYEGLSALEMAVMNDARWFLCSGPVESVINRIWSGHIAFWNELTVDGKRSPHKYQPHSAANSMYTRLRVPRYRTFFMMVNYAILLVLFYALLFKQQSEHSKSHDTTMTRVEGFVHVWFWGVVLDEVAQMREAGSIGRYIVDYWSVFDVAVISIYLAFCIMRVVAHASVDYAATQQAFDTLSLEALLLFPRFFSFVAIYPYFGTLLPCMKRMMLEFFKALSLIFIVYLGFFTTFVFLGRDTFSISEMSWLLVNVFFGDAGKGFQAAPRISAEFGQGLMLCFNTLSHFMLVPVLVSMMSSRFQETMEHAREEYVTLFASTVCEAVTTAERLTYFYPPLNILTVVMRPLRLFMSQNGYRRLKLSVLKATHWPYAVMIKAFENTEHHYQVRKRRALYHRQCNRQFSS